MLVADKFFGPCISQVLKSGLTLLPSHFELSKFGYPLWPMVSGHWRYPMSSSHTPDTQVLQVYTGIVVVMYTYIHTDRQPGRQPGRQAGRHTDIQTYRHTDRQTDRQTYIHTYHCVVV